MSDLQWQPPERGQLSPGVFLPVIEEHALTVDVGEWVIKSALRQLEAWQAIGLDIPISVNVGARQLQELVARLYQGIVAVAGEILQLDGETRARAEAANQRRHDHEDAGVPNL